VAVAIAGRNPRSSVNGFCGRAKTKWSRDPTVLLKGETGAEGTTLRDPPQPRKRIRPMIESQKIGCDFKISEILENTHQPSPSAGTRNVRW